MSEREDTKLAEPTSLDEESLGEQEAEAKKEFVEPQLEKHSSLPRVTSGFAASFIP